MQNDPTAEQAPETVLAPMEKLTLYIPDRDKNNVEVGTQRRYVLEALELLARMGVARHSEPLEGAWINPETNALVWDRPVLIYGFVTKETFTQHLPELRRFLHKMGRETNQGEVALEYSGKFYRIIKFDEAS